MKRIQCLFILISIGILIFSSCGTPLYVTSDYDRNANFQQYKTFTVEVPDKNNMPISDLNANRIDDAVRAEMIKKGFTESKENPDLLVHMATILKEKKQVTASTDYYSYGGMYRPYGWGAGTGTTTYNVYDYIDGSLIIDVVDVKAQKLIWEGIGNKEIDSPLQDPEKNIPIAVAKIMAGFPPGAAPAK